MPEQPDILFHEVQSFLPMDPLWNWVFLGICAAIPCVIILWMIIARVRHGKGWPKKQGRAIAALLVAVFFVLLAPILALLVLPTLTVEVRPTELTAQLWPFQLDPERIRISAIRSHSVRRYDPVGEYGGWGIRHGRDGGRAYNARGNVGVQLVFQDEGRLLLGSQRSEELDAALQLARSRLPSQPSQALTE